MKACDRIVKPACGNSHLRQILNNLALAGGLMVGAAVEGAQIKSATVAQMMTHPLGVAKCIESSYWHQKPEVLSAIKNGAGGATDLDNTFTSAAGRFWSTLVYGVLVEINATQTQGLPGFTINVAGRSVYDDAIALSATVDPAFQDPSGAKKVRLWLFPALAWNGGYTYVPFVFRPLLATAGPPAATIACTFGGALPSGVTCTYTLLTRGIPELDSLIRARMDREAKKKNVQTASRGRRVEPHTHGQAATANRLRKVINKNGKGGRLLIKRDDGSYDEVELDSESD